MSFGSTHQQPEVLRFVALQEALIPELTGIMVAAFDDDSRRFRGMERGGPPGYEDGSFLRKWGLASPTHSYVVYLGDAMVGAYIVWWRKEESRLGAVFLDPKQQNKGIGGRVWDHIEKTYPTEAWLLDTPVWATRCHHFYQRCGFKAGETKGDQVMFRKRIVPGIADTGPAPERASSPATSP